jgi:hypothetical protein
METPDFRTNNSAVQKKTSKPATRTTSKTQGWTPINTTLVIVLTIAVLALSIGLGLFFGLPKKGTSTHTGHAQDVSLVKIGVVISTNVTSNAIPLSKILDRIDFFWDWLPAYKPATYDVIVSSAIKNKYIPMNWMSEPAPDELLNWVKTASSQRVFLANEPDMAGSIIGLNKQTNLPDASGAGFWLDSASGFPYGNATEGGFNSLDDAKKGITSFKALAQIYQTNIVSIKNAFPNAVVASPAMAQSADLIRGCAGYREMKTGATRGCTDNNIKGILKLEQSSASYDKTYMVAGPCGYSSFGTIDVPAPCNSNDAAASDMNGLTAYGTNESVCATNGCSYGNSNSCSCNGYLSLVRDMADEDSTWWSTTGIINVHCYSQHAHLVKKHLCEYLFIYADSMQQRDSKTVGKELWLTEVACIFAKSDLRSPADINIEFIKELLYLDTSDVDPKTLICLDYSKYNIASSLPGLRSTTKFKMNDKMGTWYDHGFGGVSWFASASFPGFQTDCSEDFSALVDSNIFDTDGKPNGVFNALVGY